jgi:two-component system, response regulator PdtaR
MRQALVFTDVQMPGTMDGIKLSHYIRDRWPPLKLTVASGASILEESSLPMGSRFFSKPYDDHTITEAMAGCFRATFRSPPQSEFFRSTDDVAADGLSRGRSGFAEAYKYHRSREVLCDPLRLCGLLRREF